MKKFLTKKWLAPIVLFAYVLTLSLFLVNKITPSLKELLPVVIQESDAFLPITIQNGEIVEPVNTVINKSYSNNGETFNITLDTRTEKLDLNSLSNEGIYLSKKCIYMVSKEETRVRCLSSSQSQEPIVITKETVERLADYLNKHMGTFLGVFFAVILFVVLYLIILFYTIIMHWIVALLTKTTFGQTLFINTFVYIGCNLVEIFYSINIGFWLKVILLICFNFIICKSVKKDEME